MTAKNLLLKILDYQYQWGLLLRIESRPAKIRKQQIISLLNALGLKKTTPDVAFSESIDRLLRGEFLIERSREKNKEIVDRIMTTLQPRYPHITTDKEMEPSDIRWLFNDLINFRAQVYKIAYTGAIEESSLGLLYSQHLQCQLQEVIKNNLEEIDETLWILLDPEKRKFDKKTLVESYGYPEEDLEEADLEWMMNDPDGESTEHFQSRLRKYN